jgi:hypothetical protein
MPFQKSFFIAVNLFDLKKGRLFDCCPIFANYVGHFLSMNPEGLARIHI